MRTYLCEGYCPFLGPIRAMIEARDFGDAKTKFFIKHRVQATHVCLER